MTRIMLGGTFGKGELMLALIIAGLENVAWLRGLNSACEQWRMLKGPYAGINLCMKMQK